MKCPPSLGGISFIILCGEDSNRERGRENGSFPVAEILKPMGFRERVDTSDVRFLASALIQKTSSVKKRGRFFI